MERDFNRGWIFQKEGGEKTAVDLPHDAMLFEMRTTACYNGERTGYFPGGRYIYSKKFLLGENEASGYIALRFGGVYRHAKVFLNGEQLAFQRYGYIPFTVDLTGKAISGENTVVVEVDNSLEPNCRWYSGSGIYRSVKLLTAGKNRIGDTWVSTRSLSPAVITVSTGEANASVEIFDGNRLLVSGEPGEIRLPNVEPWSPDHPKLYTCVIRTADDEMRMSFGVRTLEVASDKGLLLNGCPIKLRGGCVHHDNGILGACSFKDAELRRVRLLKEAGFNAIRCAHNPCSDELLEACDELGMLVLDEAYDGWYTPKNHHDSARDFEDEYEFVVSAMVKRDRIHPSVILYSIGNEVTEVAEERGIDLLKSMQDSIHRIDPTRPVTCGINTMLTVWAGMGLAVYKDKEPYSPIPLPPKNDGNCKNGSAFFNALAAKLGKMMDVQTKGKKADRALDGIGSALDVFGLNYGSLRYQKELRQHPDRILLGTENRIDNIPYIWQQVESSPAIVGDFCWTAMDYLGEAGIGHWNYPSERGLPLTAGCGALDLIGTPDVMNGFQRIIWGLEKNPVISVQPMNHQGERPITKAWRFTNGVASWTWPGYEGKQAKIEVFSNAGYVELYLNGHSLGKKKVKKYRAIFRIPYESGELRAISYDERGIEAGCSYLQTAGPAGLQIQSEKNLLQANGRDLCYLNISIADERGIVHPIDGAEIRVTVNGAASLAGFGSAAPITDECFTNSVHTTWRGRNLAVIRAGYEAGEADIHVDAGIYGQNRMRISVI